MRPSLGLRDDQDAAAGRIVIIDDDPGIRGLLRRVLTTAEYRIEEYGEAVPGLARIREEPPDLVLLDLQLPDRNGHEVLEEIRSDPKTRLLPVVMLTGVATSAEKVKAMRLGVTDFLAKPFSPEELLPRVRSLVHLKQFADEHEHAEHVILTLARTIDARDPHTAGHSGRVAEWADRVAQRLGLETAARTDMRRGALFHDLGKIVVPDAILHKPGKLDEGERRIIEEHPVVGYELLSPMKTMRKALPIVRSHHEKLDGSGYPDGLAGDDIPPAVSIVTVADVFDAMTKERPYRQAFPVPAAFEALRDGVRKGWWNGDAVGELEAIVAETSAGAERSSGACPQS